MNGFGTHRAVVFADGSKPRPHDTAAVGSQNALGCKEIHAPRRLTKEALLFPAPVHTSVKLRDELLGLRIPIANVVAAAQRMANTQKNPLLAKREKVRAGDILAVGHIGKVVPQKVTDIGPGFQVI